MHSQAGEQQNRRKNSAGDGTQGGEKENSAGSLSRLSLAIRQLGQHGYRLRRQIYGQEEQPQSRKADGESHIQAGVQSLLQESSLQGEGNNTVDPRRQQEITP